MRKIGGCTVSLIIKGPPQFNTSVNSTHQFSTKGPPPCQLQKSVSSTQKRSVKQTSHFKTPVSSTQITRQFKTPAGLTKKPSVQNTCQFYTKNPQLNASVRQNISLFFVLYWHLFCVELPAVLIKRGFCVEMTGVLNWRSLCWTDAFDVSNWRILGAENEWPLFWTEGYSIIRDFNKFSHKL